MTMMRIRKTNAVLGSALIIGVLFMIYLVIDTISYEDYDAQKEELIQLESKLRGLENDLLVNQKTIDQIKDTVVELRKEQAVIREESKAVRAKGKSVVNKTFASIHRSDFEFARGQPATCDIRMADVYESLPFDNPDGGVWKQGWDITYDKSQWSAEKKLKIFVMPHSHNDPGWIKTFEDYYRTQTKNILDNMVVKLNEHKSMKFIWAEISFFAMWWVEQSLEVQHQVKQLVQDKRLEFVTGGWVMNDEANTFYYAMLEQLILGHEWLRLNLNYKPNNGWAIDPFGMSPTMAYLLKRTGFDNMLIQRTHYSIKKYLAKEKSLEFQWRQHWDHDQGSTDMFTHMMPFYSYDVPHTCGPDPKICCQFDFLRLPGNRATCPWRVPPQAINDRNVAERSMTLLDQYRKKAQLYKTNNVLAPLGDDFRYDSAREWDAQFDNYAKIMDYINSHPELNAEIQFGTLEDYFNAVHAEVQSGSTQSETFFPSLSGDFFTYADRDDHYWSGYYTSRPFYKNLDRILEHYMRSAEIMYSMMWAEMEYVGSDFDQMVQPLLEDIIVARQNLALFQHHDGVTGTAKDHVVVDYGNKMVGSLQKLQNVMSQSAHYLLTSSKAFYKPNLEQAWFDLDDWRENHDSLPKQVTLQIDGPDEPSRVVIFNSHARRRSEVVTIKISIPNIRVYKIHTIDGDDEEEMIPCQLSPVFDDQGEIINNEYKLSFLAQVKGMALETYFIQQLRIEEGTNTDMDIAHIVLFNCHKEPFQVAPFDNLEVYETAMEFVLQNGYVQAKFNDNGMLKSITTLDDKITNNIEIEFLTYGTRPRGDRSGAYLFLPDGPAKPFNIGKSPYMRIIQGKIWSYVEIHGKEIKHKVILNTSPGPDGTGIHITNDVDMKNMNNQELIMRFKSDLKTEDTFFTDLNGYQMIKRKRYQKLPLQANYYPIPSMAYIQDSSARLTLISRTPLGGSSLQSGHLEIMMDRRLMQDDNRGLFQGVTDNRLTRHEFTLLLERKTKGCQDEAEDVAASYPSLLAVTARHGLINPVDRLIYGDNTAASTLAKNYQPMDKDLACDIHVLNLRTMLKSATAIAPSDNVALILHRQGFNGCYKPIGMTCSTNGGKVSLEELYPELFSDSVKQMSLTLMYDGMKVEKGFTVSIKPMEMYSFLLRR